MQTLALHVGLGTAMDDRAFLELNGPAYRLAVRTLGSAQGAEDVVQQAYLAAVERMRAGRSPEELRSWFLKVVANTARKQRRGEAARKRREGAVVCQARGEVAGVSPELVETLRGAMSGLEEEYRLPVALCCEEGLSQQEAAEILEIPQPTISRRVRDGLEQLRQALSRAGYEAAPALVIGALAHTAPPVPAGLDATIGSLLAGKIVGTGSAATTAAAKGGMAMKIVAGVLVAGVLAGAVAVVGNFGAVGAQHAAPLQSPPAVGPLNGQPAPVNEYKGLQEREEKFEFAQKPAVKKEGDKWVITFATTANCDATVTVLDKEGKIVRHLASGVLGKNAPWPFQQDSLSQKIEWDGLKDDFTKADAAGCKVRVSLGLKAKFERNMAYDPYDTMSGKVLSGKCKDGTMYVAFGTRTSHYVRAYDKDGKYLHTVIPYPAAEITKKGCKFATTIWGDKVPVPAKGGLYFAGCLGEYLCNPGWFHGKNLEDFKAMKGPAGEKQSLTNVVEFMNKLPGIESVDITPRPAALPAARNCSADLTGKAPRLAVDPVREEVYAGGESLFRYNGKTGEFDPSFKDFNGTIFDQAVGPDGLIYIRVSRGALLTRVDRDGKPVPFKKDYEDAPAKKWDLPKALRGGPLSALWCGGSGSTEGCFNYCLHVSTNGLIATTTNEITEEYAKLRGVKYVRGGANHVDYVNVRDSDGRLITADAVGRVGAGFGSFMDRDGSLYVVYGDVMPAGQNKLDGIADVNVADSPGYGAWTGYGILVKYRGLGGKYPLNVGPGVKTCSGREAISKLRTNGEMAGALWAYPVPGQTDKGCSCGSFREYFDGWARTWVTSNHLYSIVVLDANGNRMARIGRYGNVDDTEADLKENRDGIRLVWPRAVAASDTALYVSDPGNMRILKAALSYAAEETAPVP